MDARVDLPLAPRDLVRYEGAYILDPDGRRLEARVYSEDGHLRIQGGRAQGITIQLGAAVIPGIRAP
jgi:hypothetical protein